MQHYTTIPKHPKLTFLGGKKVCTAIRLDKRSRKVLIAGKGNSVKCYRFLVSPKLFVEKSSRKAPDNLN